MGENKGQTIFLSVIGIATLLVAIIGATFAYFSTTMTGDQSNTRASVTTAKVAQVVFSGWNAEITASNALPGKVVVNNQSFTVAATGDMSGATIPYTCTLTRTAAATFPSFEYKFADTSNGGTWTTAATTALHGTLTSNSQTDTYFVSVRFKETGAQQNNTAGDTGTTNEQGETGSVAVSCVLDGGSVVYYNDANPTGTNVAPNAID